MPGPPVVWYRPAMDPRPAAPRHTLAFRCRRALNWFPLGIAYAFLYMGRYNLTVAKNALGDLLTKSDFGQIFGVGAVVYGCAFAINGPLTDRIGGRRTMLLGMAGALAMNAAMGTVLWGTAGRGWGLPLGPTFALLYALNMYFQSFGAVAIISVKAPWFHVRERGTFSSIFGAMIAVGVYLAFDWGSAIVEATRAQPRTDLGLLAGAIAHLLGNGAGVSGGVDRNWWLFFIPALGLLALWLVLFAFLRDTPEDAGFTGFDTGEASLSEGGERLPARVIFKRIIGHPVLAVICGIAFASGVLRNGVIQWYPIFAKETGIAEHFLIARNWGLALLLAGIGGATLTGWASDRFFRSRRGPMAAVMCGVAFVAAIAMCAGLGGSPWVTGGAAVAISAAVIGVHGIMAGTTSVDFGGSKNAGAAVGMVDGLVYAGTALQSFLAGLSTPQGEAAHDPRAWLAWPAVLAPFALAGALLSIRIWNALPRAVPEVRDGAATPVSPSPSPLASGPPPSFGVAGRSRRA